jgi:hypothetical protein
VTTWAQVDAFREEAAWRARALKGTPRGEWRAFAKLVLVPRKVGAVVRVRGREGDRRLKLERPCYFNPKAWRSLGFVRATHLEVDLAALRKLTPASREALRPALDALRVAHDEWLGAGCPRRPRCVEITTPAASAAPSPR